MSIDLRIGAEDILSWVSPDIILVTVFIGILLFFLYQGILKRFVRNNRKRVLIALVAAVGTAPAVCGGLIILFIFYLTYSPSTGFDCEAWQRDRQRRFQMANDIIGSKMLIGKDSLAVKQLLGEPTWRDSSNQSFTYDMGWGGGGLGFLSHKLKVAFHNGRVAKAEHEEIMD